MLREALASKSKCSVTIRNICIFQAVQPCRLMTLGKNKRINILHWIRDALAFKVYICTIGYCKHTTELLDYQFMFYFSRIVASTACWF